MNTQSSISPNTSVPGESRQGLKSSPFFFLFSPVPISASRPQRGLTNQTLLRDFLSNSGKPPRKDSGASEYNCLHERSTSPLQPSHSCVCFNMPFSSFALHLTCPVFPPLPFSPPYSLTPSWEHRQQCQFSRPPIKTIRKSTHTLLVA